MFSANCWLLAVTLYTRGTRRGGAKSQKSQVANGDIIPLNNKAIFLGGWPCQIHIRRRSLRNRIPVSKEQKAFWTLKSKQEFAVSLHTPIRTLDMRPESPCLWRIACRREAQSRVVNQAGEGNTQTHS